VLLDVPDKVPSELLDEQLSPVDTVAVCKTLAGLKIRGMEKFFTMKVASSWYSSLA
jgi:hypothetical protein